MPAGSCGRIFFDITTSMRWSGPPAGIVRVERKLALWAHAHVPGIEFVFFDPGENAYRELRASAWVLLTGGATLNTLGLKGPTARKRRTDRVPAPLRSAFLAITQSRRTLLYQLERIRLQTNRVWVALLAERLQRPLISAKYRKFMLREDGTRKPFLPYDMAVGSKVTLGCNDTLVCAGAGWGNTSIEVLQDLKARVKFRLVLFCHDLIPLLFPHFYKPHDVDLFRNYMQRVLPIVDRVIVASGRTAADCRAVCAQLGIRAPDLAVIPLGFDVDAARSNPQAALPAGLQAGRFALLVSTIEPRKGHELLYRVWVRLVTEGLAKSTGFKLVFAGRSGWMVDELLSEIRHDRRVADSLMIMNDVDDPCLASLYAGAAFCVYPSQYEGYGLPVVEAFAHGKALLASTGGALPELVLDFSPCLDPTDEDAWYNALKQWIETPQAARRFEQRIREQFRHPTWAEAAAAFFRHVAPAAEPVNEA
jgi:glycosyltransferase involved in cell wall biosynthesis